MQELTRRQLLCRLRDARRKLAHHGRRSFMGKEAKRELGAVLAELARRGVEPPPPGQETAEWGRQGPAGRPQKRPGRSPVTEGRGVAPLAPRPCLEETMTNRELLDAPTKKLTQLERQRQFLLRVEMTPVPCPACQAPVDALTAAGVDIDDHDFGHTELSYRCPGCQAELEHVVPLFVAPGPGWVWTLKQSWLIERLRRAELYDRGHGQEAR